MLKRINKNRLVVLGGNGLIMFSILLVLRMFINLHDSILIMNNPLLPKDLFYELNLDRTISGIILSVGLIMMTMLMFIQQNTLLLFAGLLVLLLYYLKIMGWL